MPSSPEPSAVQRVHEQGLRRAEEEEVGLDDTRLERPERALFLPLPAEQNVEQQDRNPLPMLARRVEHGVQTDDNRGAQCIRQMPAPTEAR